jgi:glycosyltransferase involved in cell wall biosynthesis
MKIVHYINNLGSGGAEKLLTDILPMMKDKGHHVELIISNGNVNIKKYEDLLNENNITLINFNVSFYNPIQLFKLINYVSKNKPDIFHAHIFPTQYWLALASFFFSRKTKLIKTEHNVHNNRRNKKVNKIIEKIIYKRYKRVIAITQEVKESLQKWIDDVTVIKIVYNGVNLKQINREKVKTIEFDLTNTINLFMVARFDFNAKDHFSLIEALFLLPKEYKLFLAGEGPNLINVKEQVNNLDLNERVVFLGLRSDVYAIMSKVDLNILSTNYEGLSGVALESLASGKPFIGSDVPGVNTIVPNADFLFPPKSPKILANKIIEVTTNKELSQNMVVLSLKYVEGYDTSVMLKGYLKIYDEVLNT